MKKKILIGIVGVALFAIAMTINLNVKQDSLAVENADAFAKDQWYMVVACTGGDGYCLLDMSAGSTWVNHIVPVEQ